MRYLHVACLSLQMLILYLESPLKDFHTSQFIVHALMYIFVTPYAIFSSNANPTPEFYYNIVPKTFLIASVNAAYFSAPIMGCTVEQVSPL